VLAVGLINERVVAVVAVPVTVKAVPSEPAVIDVYGATVTDLYE